MDKTRELGVIADMQSITHVFDTPELIFSLSEYSSLIRHLFHIHQNLHNLTATQ